MAVKSQIVDTPYFDPKAIFNCGQAFRGRTTADGFLVPVEGRLIAITPCGGGWSFQSDRPEADRHYFDFNTDYGALRRPLHNFEAMRTPMAYGRGIRLLNQSPFETICTFIISQNSHIPRIKKTVEWLAATFGSEIREGIYSFPTPQALASADLSILREQGKLGYRDKYILGTAQAVAEARVTMAELMKLDRDRARELLLTLPGVGPKVADCILLFGLGHKDAFPVDVWIQRVMEHLFLQSKTSKSRIAIEGRRLFGESAGLAQQYLFYYGREHSDVWRHY
ncbi:8-oxoguanine DNA glycosylase [Peptoniphilus equinus]|uniref:DNA-(apurinic or apyrimidinic site) lyase n=1 Tax=Peptoniphilus equinus TaxID=3016343 RepID=A0ABY7QT19_9FIRM|nr:DNA glycosylase [Peptoniphilus equinus]WBW49941.1 8-oxoguanine DNA glycosylase [Peptoniphilus equinus]